MFHSIRQFWQLTRPFKGRLAAASGLLAVDALLAAFSVVTIAPLADLVLEKARDQWMPVTTRMESLMTGLGLPFDMVSVAMVFFLFTLGMAVFSVFVRWILTRLRVDVVRYLINRSLEKMFDAGWGYFSASKRGTLMNTYLREVNNTGAAFQSLSLSVASLVRVAAFIVVPLLLEPVLVTICLLAAMLLILPFMYIGKWSTRFGKRDVAASNRYASLVRESIEAAREVISYGRQRRTIDQIDQAYGQFGESRVKAETFSVFASQMYEPVGILVLLGVLVAARQAGDAVALSSVAVVLWGLVRSIAPLKQLIQLKHNLDNRLPSLQQVLAEQARATSFRQAPGSQVPGGGQCRIEFRQAGLRYDDGSQALEDCSFDMSGPGVVALVGESGSGKSTIVDLVLGLLQPSSGQVLMNGIDSGDIDLARWREALAIVPQQPVLFDLSVRDNLLWAEPGASEDELWRICETAGAADFIRGLPAGLDTEIGDSGVRLSGGQVQRLALARALIRRPKLLILDEATSALDTETEARVYRSLQAETRDCLVMVVAHRLSTIAGADDILVMQQGRLVERGNYAALVAREGYFHRLLRAQPSTGLAA